MSRTVTKEDLIIAGNLKRLRKSCKLSQEKISNLFDISFQQYSKYELGKNRISAGLLIRLAAILEVDIKEFYTQETEIFPDKQALLSKINKIKCNKKINFLLTLTTIMEEL